jgi:hypothetical protein
MKLINLAYYTLDGYRVTADTAFPVSGFLEKRIVTPFGKSSARIPLSAAVVGL